LFTKADMVRSRRTMARILERLNEWHRQSHTFMGGDDSLLVRVAEDWPGALDELERLWKRGGGR
jgi:hypothetical protein